MDHYIYYRVADGDGAALEAAVMPMQATLRAAHGVTASLKCRPAPDGGARTYMEVYEKAGPQFAAAVAAAVIDAGLATLTLGQRHVELFEDVAPCA